MSAPTLAFKGVAVDEGTDSQVVDINEAEGIVTAVVSVTGTKDDVDDVIIPGAYAETLKTRNPKVCWHHSWEKPIGRVLHVEELMPGDSRLPTKQRNGQPWPKEAGALIATMQFNLKSQRGKEAFEAVVFYSETGECEWSIGYQVEPGKWRRDKQGVRWIKAIDLYELSFVLFGAHNMTGTLALKAAAMVMQMHAASTKAAGGSVVLRREEFEQAIKALAMDDGSDPAEGDPAPVDDPVTDPAADPAADPAGAPADPAAPVDGSDDEDEDGVPPVVLDEGSGDQAELISEEDAEDNEDEPLPGDDPGTDAPTDTPADAPAAPAPAPAPAAQPEAAAKSLEAARMQIRVKSVATDADTTIQDTCTCGDTVVFDTMNGWMREDGSYSHDDGTTHSDWLEPPDASELMYAAGSKRLPDYLAATLDDVYPHPLPKSFGIELTPLGEVKDTNPGDQSQGARELIHWYEHGEGAAKIRWGEKGDFMRCVRIAEKHMTPEQAKGFCSNRHLGALGVRPGQEKAFQPDVDPLDYPAADKTDDESEQTGVMVAVFLPDDVAQQVAVRGGEPPEDLHVTLAFMGDISDDVGGGVSLGDAAAQIVAAVQIAAAAQQPLTGSIGGIGKFPDSGDGVPIWAPVDVVGLTAFREAVVTALTDAGLPVKVDHGFTPHCTLGWNLDLNLIQPVDDVPVTFDHAVVAVGGERMNVPFGTDTDIPVSGAPVAGAPLNPPLPGDQQKAAEWNPAIETGPEAGNKPPVTRQRKMFPYLEGTYEERQRALEAALCDALLPEPDPEDDSNRPYLSIDGTWPDRVVCTVHAWAGPGPSDQQSWEVQYSIAEDGTVSLGEPEKVRLTVTAVDDEGEDIPGDVPVGDLLPLAEMIETVTGGLKTVTGGIEVKAGRVLSAANAQRLKSAIEHLIAVVASAGIEIGDPTDQPAGRTDPTVDTETTAPAARDSGSKALTRADLTSALADLEAALEN